MHQRLTPSFSTISVLHLCEFLLFLVSSLSIYHHYSVILRLSLVSANYAMPLASLPSFLGAGLLSSYLIRISWSVAPLVLAHIFPFSPVPSHSAIRKRDFPLFFNYLCSVKRSRLLSNKGEVDFPLIFRD